MVFISPMATLLESYFYESFGKVFNFFPVINFSKVVTQTLSFIKESTTNTMTFSYSIFCCKFQGKHILVFLKMSSFSYLSFLKLHIHIDFRNKQKCFPVLSKCDFMYEFLVLFFLSSLEIQLR